MMTVENMTEVKLNEVVDKYETLMAATKGLNKSNKDKEEAKVVKGEEKRMTCYRCQAQGHRAEQCKTLKSLTSQHQRALLSLQCSEDDRPSDKPVSNWAEFEPFWQL